MNIPTSYRKNVAIFVLNGEGRILMCERADIKNAWQLPQGGVDEGEDLEQAALRELEEEIGTKEVEVIGSLLEPIRYEWPESNYYRNYRGQEQYYFLVKLASKAKIDFFKHHTVEFVNSAWLSGKEFVLRLSGFRREAYKEALEKLIKKYPQVILEE